MYTLVGSTSFHVISTCMTFDPARRLFFQVGSKVIPVCIVLQEGEPGNEATHVYMYIPISLNGSSCFS